MTAPIIPNLPDVTGETVGKDQQLRDFLIAVKITLEKLTGATPAELDELLEKNE
jgi:hypothetical protein